MRIFALLLVVTSGFSQGINTKTIGTQVPAKIVLNQSVATILQFPAPISAVYGKGVTGVTGKDNADNDVQVESSANRPVLVLTPLKPNIHVSMTVYMTDKMYVFNLVDGDNPDLAVTLKAGDVPANPNEKVTPQMVADARPKPSSEMLISLMDRAQGAALLQAADPDDYKGYQHRQCNYVSDDGYLKIEAKEIHKFATEDAIVVTGSITNQTDSPIAFSADHAAISVGNVKHPLSLLSCRRPVLAHATTAFLGILVGDLDGSRAGFSLDNEFRLVVDTGHYQDKAPEPKPETSPSPTPYHDAPWLNKPPTPLTQTKNEKHP